LCCVCLRVCGFVCVSVVMYAVCLCTMYVSVCLCVCLCVYVSLFTLSSICAFCLRVSCLRVCACVCCVSIFVCCAADLQAALEPSFQDPLFAAQDMALQGYDRAWGS
jgi:hypothetical protein